MCTISNLAAAVANSGAMEADTIQNGRKSKSQMSRIITVLIVIMFSIASCGGGGGGNKIPNGTYFLGRNDVNKNVYFIFSGNKFTINNEERGVYFPFTLGTGTYEIIKSVDGDNFIIFTYNNADVVKKKFSRVEDIVQIDGWSFIKK